MQRVYEAIRRAGAAMLFSIVLALPSQAATGLMSFPLYAHEDGYFVTPIRLNGAAEISGVIDTAATFAMIDAHAARLAGIAPPGIEVDEVEVLGLLGSEAYPVVDIRRAEAGTVTLGAIRAAYNDREGMPGVRTVLPLSIFPGDVADFDFPEGRLTIYDGAPQPASAATVRKTRLEYDGGLYFIDISINGQRGRALVDTGSPVTIINHGFALAAGAARNDEKSKLLTGATGGNMVVEVAAARRIVFAGFSVPQMDLVVADAAFFADLGMADGHAMILGLDVLQNFRLQMDRRNGELVFVLPSPGDERAGSGKGAAGAR